jgi:hypothetical protein
MTAKTEKAAELRQASPFAGALTQEEIARTIHREKERARTHCGRQPNSPNGLIPADCDPPDATKLLECPGLFDANEPLGPQ